MEGKRERDSLKTFGTILSSLGIGVWGVYALLRFGMGWDATVQQFLLYHLAGIVPGIVLRRHRFFGDMIKRLLS